MSAAIKRLLIALVAIEALIVALDYLIIRETVTDDGDYRRLFDIAREESIPTLFSSVQAIAVGAAILGILLVRRLRGARRRELAGWVLIGTFFVFIGIDDGSRLHERVGSAIGETFAADPEKQSAVVEFLVRTPSYYWISFLGPVFAGFGLFMIVFLWRYLGAFRLRRFMIAGLTLYGAAVALDFLEGTGGFFPDLASTAGASEYAVSHAFKVTEEAMEMLGTTVLLIGFLTYLAHIADGLQLNLTRTEAPQDPAPGAQELEPQTDRVPSTARASSPS